MRTLVLHILGLVLSFTVPVARAGLLDQLARFELTEPSLNGICETLLMTGRGTQPKEAVDDCATCACSGYASWTRNRGSCGTRAWTRMRRPGRGWPWPSTFAGSKCGENAPPERTPDRRVGGIECGGIRRDRGLLPRFDRSTCRRAGVDPSSSRSPRFRADHFDSERVTPIFLGLVVTEVGVGDASAVELAEVGLAASGLAGLTGSANKFRFLEDRRRADFDRELHAYLNAEPSRSADDWIFSTRTYRVMQPLVNAVWANDRPRFPTG